MHIPGKEHICSLHEGILSRINLVKQSLKKEPINKEFVEEMLLEIEQLTINAHKAGKSMGNRLVKYREAVESLGFDRV